MATWKVFKDKITIFEHPDAEKLQLGKVGPYQVVVQKGLYEDGDDVVFAPDKSVLSGVIEQEFKQYLVGPDKNRVKAIRLRNELSSGIIIPPHIIKEQCGKGIDDLPYTEDLSELMGIAKYVPPVPIEMAGVAAPIEYDHLSIKHDVEQFGIYAGNFIDDERVICSEKIHGSQIVAYIALDGDGNLHRWVSTKNYNAAGLCILESDTNFYWKCVRNVSLWEKLQDLLVLTDLVTKLDDGGWVIQVFGEALPCQSMKYGFVEPTMRIFGLSVNGVTIPYDKLPDFIRDLWVPVLYDGPYTNVPELKKLALGNETVSGNELHIKEGIVIRPYEDRRASDGTWLKVKVINPKYKETGEEFS